MSFFSFCLILPEVHSFLFVFPGHFWITTSRVVRVSSGKTDDLCSNARAIISFAPSAITLLDLNLRAVQMNPATSFVESLCPRFYGHCLIFLCSSFLAVLLFDFRHLGPLLPSLSSFEQRPRSRSESDCKSYRIAIIKVFFVCATC